MNVLVHNQSFDANKDTGSASQSLAATQNQFLYETESSVADFLQAPMDMLQIQAAEQEINLFYEATKAKINIKIDEEKIRQSVIHVVQNAIKYSEPSKSVYVITGRDFNGDFYIRVDDEGKGIAADLLERILEPFTMVENGIESSNSSAGRGLSLVNAYLKMHFGYLRVQSQINHGTSVTLTLPKSCILSR